MASYAASRLHDSGLHVWAHIQSGDKIDLNRITITAEQITELGTNLDY